MLWQLSNDLITAGEEKPTPTRLLDLGCGDNLTPTHVVWQLESGAAISARPQTPKVVGTVVHEAELSCDEAAEQVPILEVPLEYRPPFAHGARPRQWVVWRDVDRLLDDVHKPAEHS